MISIDNGLLGIALFLIVSVLASKVAVKSGIPALLLFLLVGMLAGSEGIGGIYFDYFWVTQFIGIMALAFILFSGGLDTNIHHIRPVLKEGIAISTVGVLVTALTVGWLLTTFLNFSWTEGILIGAIISATDAAAVFSVLRGQNVNLKGQLKPLLELESGSNDPMAVFLTLGMIQLILNPSDSALTLIPIFIIQMAIGMVLGYGIGRLIVAVINRLNLEYEGLYPVLTLALAIFTYSLTASLQGNGFLAVYLAGLVLGNSNFIHKRSLLRFHDGLAWLMQIVMFLTLGLQVYPSRLQAVAPIGMITALFLIFIARPLSVFLALSFTRMNVREKLFISWVGLRGAAPIVLATFPLLATINQADTIFHLVFFIVITSVLLQGTTIVRVAKWLNVYSPEHDIPPSPLEFVMQDGIISSDLLEVTVSDHAAAVGKQILNLQLPQGALIVLIGRSSDMIVPNGSTVIEAGDRVLFLASAAVREELMQKLCPEISEISRT